MIRKLVTLFIMLALVIQLVPANRIETAHAATGNFTFPSESDQIGSPRVTTEERITLQGTLNNVDPTSISYSVLQIIDPTDETKTGSTRENLTSNISVNGFSLQVFNIQLFPGLNKITFKGTQGGGEVANSIYVEYRNGPMLYDLTASLDGNNFPIVENGTTVVQSTTSRGRSSADISITGKAPNAQQVTIIVNGSSKTYSVNSANNDSFAAAPITLQKGKNQVTIRIKNGTQVIETSRDLAFYNGSVTFYDVNVNEFASAAPATILQSGALEYSPNFVIDTANNLSLTGKVIVPNSVYAEPVGTPPVMVDKPHPDPTVPLASLKAQIKKVTDATFTNLTIPLANIVPVGTPSITDKFFVFQYTISLGAASGYSLDTLYNVKLTARNEENAHLNVTPTEQSTDALYFSLRDKNKPFISQINYLTGYKPTNYQGIEGTPLEGKNIYGLPVGIEVLVGNPSGTNNLLVTKISDLYGHNSTPVLKAVPAAGGSLASNEYAIREESLVTRTVNGTAQTFKRFVLEFYRMPYEGTQTITVQVGGASGDSKSSKFTLLYGPYANFNTIFDGMTVKDDSTLSTADRVAQIITSKLGNFQGSLQNINNTSEIRYDNSSGSPRTVYFYINNVSFPLKAVGTDVTQFALDPTDATVYTKALNALFNGENVIKFVFQSSKSYYEKVIKVNKVPTNLPVIPAQTTGVFPFTFEDAITNPKPILNDPNFKKIGSIYNTTEPFMNVFGTFDFIDLGDSTATINSKMTSLLTPDGTGHVPASDYILKITGASLTTPITWKLSEPFQIVNGDTPVGMYPTGGNINGDLVVRYDTSTQSFQFLLRKQELNADGSSSVLLFNVYNSGETGPKATYRLEVDPTVLPYKILRPYLPAEGIVNKNFVEVIINAKGADKVTVNKQAADKYAYDADNTPANGIEYPNAFKATLSGLKPGVNKINFTIESASDSVSNYFEITYTPTNIPGAEFLDEMKSSNKVFDGAVSLTFPKGTSLIRRDFNVPANLKSQVFTGHKLLFAIANPEDGVVDRREYDNPPADFDLIMQNFGTRFKVSFPTRFVKASPVYWIDAGLADDTTTPNYDPLKYGVDPYQYPGAKGPADTKIPTYDERPDDRELVASKRGSLTLSFDPSIRNTAGTIVTVYRYDVKNKFWVNLGGTVDTKKNTITVPFDQFGYYVVAKMGYSFSDVTNHPYARNYIEAIYSKGVMNAANFDDFGADMYTTRGEFTSMIVKALNIPLNYELSKPHFDDVPPIINQDALWDYSTIETAAREGIIRGTQPRAFEPTANLSRGDAAVFLARALNLKLDTDPDKIDKALQKTFKDYSDIDYYAKASVLAIAKKGYIKGSPVDPADPKKGFTFEPKSSLLRSDAAIIIGKMLADLKKLPKLN
ncbi:S-layer homology domain-containing protein [Paenibacillus sp. CF384]|uniref:S-layer homology domain-containing protein n=1 Tax=Paenibacillus sp. CF384 TaxID=1884382 RepID=UPI00089552C8|nr:S-layer homology domain-containing protein [Paenibacillus sp. CF384]SDX27885.1 S-layer homology domain-containing protein [Paenibacillus sp. CF384]